jgi:uncharacterized protein
VGEQPGKFIRSLSPRLEFLLVVGFAFDWLIIVSILRGLGAVSQRPFDNYGLLKIVAYELVVGGVLIAFLRLRGWTLAKVRLEITWMDSGLGLVLLAATTLAWWLVLLVTYLLSQQTIESIQNISRALGGHPVSIFVNVPASAINAVFEELIVTGYVITALKPMRGVWFAVNVSVAIRVAYHLYQGPMAALGVLPLALIYAAFYIRSGNLWPLVVAHTLQDVMALQMHP